MPRKREEPTWADWAARVRAKVDVYEPITPVERLASLREQGFFPHGVFLPDDDHDRLEVQSAVRTIGAMADLDMRMRAYHDLQQLGEEWEAAGIVGRWTGQMGVVRSKATFRIVAWGRRSGKTTHAANEAVAFARTRPRAVIWVVGQTFKIVGRCFTIIEQKISDMALRTSVHRSTEQTKFIVLENGSTIEGVSLENFKAVAGAAVDLAIVDEAAQVEETAWERAILPPLTDHQGSALLISSFEGEGDFFHTKAMLAKKHAQAQGTDADWEYFQEPSWDANFYLFPQGQDSPMIVKMRSEMDPLDYLEQFGAIPAKAKELVFPEFRERVHVKPLAYDREQPVIVGVDPTGGSSPYAITVWQNYGSHVHIIDEYWLPGGTSAAELSPILKRREWADGVTDMVVDSAAYTEAEYWARLGWPAYPVFEKPPITERLPIYRNLLRDPKTYYQIYRTLMNELLEKKGYEANYDFLLPPERVRQFVLELETALSDQNITTRNLELLRKCSRVFIDPSCVQTIREHKVYKFPRKKPGANVRENPVDANNDLMDTCLVAGTLVTTAHGDTPIEMVGIGDYVATRHGWKPVTATWVRQPAPVVMKVRLSNGRALTGTPDHGVWTENRGWAELQSLTQEDILREWSTQKPSTSRVFPTDATRTLRGGNSASTSTLLEGLRRDVRRCIKRFGWTRTGLSRLGTMFTTRTKTPSTTTPITSCASSGHGTSESMLPAGTSPTRKLLGNAWKPSGLWLPSGTDLRKAVNGTGSMAEMSKRGGSLSSISASTAEKPTRRRHEANDSPTAQKLAKRMLGEYLESTTRVERARTAGPCSISTDTSERRTAPKPVLRVVGVETLTGHFPVYDLSVEDSHEFFAEGVLVHNCGYLVWTFFRYDEHVLPTVDASSLTQVFTERLGAPAVPPVVDLRPSPTITENTRRGFLSHVREQFGQNESAQRVQALVGTLGE